jgi:hypothetical protein
MFDIMPKLKYLLFCNCRVTLTFVQPHTSDFFSIFNFHCISRYGNSKTDYFENSEATLERFFRRCENNDA